MRKTLSVLILAVSAIFALSCSADDGWVKVEGNKFIGPDGKELIFRGLCFSDPVKLVRDRQPIGAQTSYALPYIRQTSTPWVGKRLLKQWIKALNGPNSTICM